MNRGKLEKQFYERRYENLPKAEAFIKSVLLVYEGIFDISEGINGDVQSVRVWVPFDRLSVFITDMAQVFCSCVCYKKEAHPDIPLECNFDFMSGRAAIDMQNMPWEKCFGLSKERVFQSFLQIDVDIHLMSGKERCQLKQKLEKRMHRSLLTGRT